MISCLNISKANTSGHVQIAHSLMNGSVISEGVLAHSWTKRGSFVKNWLYHCLPSFKIPETGQVPLKQQETPVLWLNTQCRLRSGNTCRSEEKDKCLWACLHSPRYSLRDSLGYFQENHQITDQRLCLPF